MFPMPSLVSLRDAFPLSILCGCIVLVKDLFLTHTPENIIYTSLRWEAKSYRSRVKTLYVVIFLSRFISTLMTLSRSWKIVWTNYYALNQYQFVEIMWHIRHETSQTFTLSTWKTCCLGIALIRMFTTKCCLSG